MLPSYKVRCGSCLGNGRTSVLSHRGRAEEQSCQSAAHHPQYTSLFCVQTGTCSMPDPALKLKIIIFQHVQLKRINSKDRPMGNSSEGQYVLSLSSRIGNGTISKGSAYKYFCDIISV